MSMSMSMKDLVAEARGRIAAVSPHDAHEGGGLVLDVREPDELSEKGRVPGALHIPRGMLEANADPDSPVANETLTAERDGRTVDVLCASGARAALAAATLDRMGYRARVIEGGLGAWSKAGLPVED
ncbi:rhodanese-like domain-containing protein [Jannaschia rubra]|jgi:rhodanese-related sulfurtransferase|uniref:Inner membrane protein YgaP n=1 Tax=Jannaschia rubra TaxID=282197 RepID=A0A0M6XW51_9RHOB|nr:rhodanese-like domain-containing protein [Jannaschia rubra]CTQ34511.1 Inner membrane protein YgaP [Jannaschia rubra]